LLFEMLSARQTARLATATMTARSNVNEVRSTRMSGKLSGGGSGDKIHPKPSDLLKLASPGCTARHSGNKTSTITSAAPTAMTTHCADVSFILGTLQPVSCARNLAHSALTIRVTNVNEQSRECVRHDKSGRQHQRLHNLEPAVAASSSALTRLTGHFRKFRYDPMAVPVVNPIGLTTEAESRNPSVP
jgi:hypothetical protein